jgi:hypothetical protein
MSYMQPDIARAVKRWSPILESLGIKDTEKKEWMAEYAENHSFSQHNGAIREGVAYGTQSSSVGMGPISAPVVGNVPGSFDPSTGAASGNDLGTSLLPVSMKIAAQTIGLDLVSTKPTPGPAIDLAFLDFKYEDTLGDEGYDNPQLFAVKVAANSTFISSLRSLLGTLGVRERVGGIDNRVFLKFVPAGVTNAQPAYNNMDTTLASASTDKRNLVEFLGFSRVTGLPLFRAFRQNNAISRGNFGSNAQASTFDINSIGGGSILSVLAGATLVNADGTLGDAILASEIVGVSAMEDQIPGFVSNWNTHAMNRVEDDTYYPNVMAPSMKVQRIGVGTIEIASIVKRNEIEDIKAQTGIDIVQKMEGVLVNELSQFISKEIVSKVFDLGERNRATAPTSVAFPGEKRFDFNTAYATDAALGGETSHAVARKLVSRIKQAQNYIAIDGRVGPAQFIVTNGHLASVLADNASYTVLPEANTKFNAPGQLYPYGTVSGMTIYVDPYMSYNDSRLVLGRKNKPEEGGLVFVPYLMAQSITLVSEATWTPRMLLRSRYALAEVGFFPHKHYMSIHVTDAQGLLG